jgi:hypothetical protein
MSDASEPEFFGLAEFLVSLVEETVEAVHRAQIVRNEDESDLRAVASLEVEAAAEKLVAIEDAQALQNELMTESGASTAWTTRYIEFVRLVEERLGIVLKLNTDYSRRNLSAAGKAKVLAAARQTLALEQLQIARRLLVEGTHRIKVASGTISVKLEMRGYRSRIVAQPRTTRPTKTKNSKLLPTPKSLDYIGRSKGLPHLSIIVRPAQRQDGKVAGVFGELKIDFLVV